ncbi:MAG: GNAT family N-acetyltransferase [Alcaligenaceae bacterium]|nr:GNAT family N-acetyltransferase [Alcaligenaceae bacterium]
MLRHRLAALFEPRATLVVSDRRLPVETDTPARLRNAVTSVAVSQAVDGQWPAELAGVPPGERLDLVLVCVPPSLLSQVLEGLPRYRPLMLVVLAHPEQSEDPLHDLEHARSWSRQHDCLVLGPRSFGVQRPHLGMNLSHHPHSALTGRVALVTQSRSIAAAVLDWAADVHLGFSAVISVGDEGAIDVAEVLDYLAMDPRTDSIALYLEEATSSRRFTSAARAAASVKPLIVLKVEEPLDRDPAHVAAFNALLRRVGAVRIRFLVQLFSAIKVLVHTRRPRGKRIALLSNGEGAARLALDVMGAGEAVLRAELASSSKKALAGLLEKGARVDNPVVSFAPFTAQGMRQTLDILVEDKAVDGVLVLLAPDPLADLEAVVNELAVVAPASSKPIVSCLMGDAVMRRLRHVLDEAGTPAFRTPESAANAFGILASYHYSQTLSQQILPPEPLSTPPDEEGARDIVRTAQRQGRLELSTEEVIGLLKSFHIPIRLVETAPEDSAAMAIHVHADPVFGPCISFGRGLEPFSRAEMAVELPPLNAYLARQLVQRSAYWDNTLVHGMTPSAFEFLREALERISLLVSDVPAIDSLSINPLYVEGDALVATCVGVRLTSASMLVLPETTGYRHMAIHPYPRHLVQMRQMPDGREWMLRPIRPEDAEPLQEFIRGLSDESRYMRFVSMLRELTPRMLARYTLIDYHRELALVATIQEPNPDQRGRLVERIIGFSHYLRNPDGRGAEYALVIGDDWQRCGLGSRLMRGLIEAAQEQGLTYIDGLVLGTNRPMLGLMSYLGFRIDPDEDDPSMRRVWLDLGETQA